MIRIKSLAGLFLGVALVAAAKDSTSSDKIPSQRNFDDIIRLVEILRGKTFLHPVPVYKISEKELRAISDRELDKEFPGPKLHSYQELLAWLDIIPGQTDLKSVYGDYFAEQVAGLYDSDAKEMCIPSFPGGTPNLGKKATEKKLEAISLILDNIILAHEFTHALEDQYWPLDDPEDYDYKLSTDRGTAHEFVNEGSATRLMIEAVPAQLGPGHPDRYFLIWDLIHSGLGEAVLRYELGRAWKSSDTLVPGVPEALARTEAMPYSFGYLFCTQVMRQWGLDGLDYVYNHPPVSSTQVMHPKKYWEWRDLPVQIDLPETLPGGWKQISLDSVGEAGMATLFGCQFKNLNYGLQLARGWDGDHVALFERTGDQRLVLWASSWNSTNAAARFAGAWVRERQVAHQAVMRQTSGDRIEWQSPDGRAGAIRRDGKRVILIETDNSGSLRDNEALPYVTFTQPAEDAARATANSTLLRFNPLWSWQKDGDYAISRSLGGLLSRHDRNSVGSSDCFVMGFLGESRRTASFHKWELGAGLIAGHESEARRGTTKTTWLPWGLLASHSAVQLPQSPNSTMRQTSVLWGLGARVTAAGEDNQSVAVLPFGLLFRHTTGIGHSATHVLGTGVSHQEATNHLSSTKRLRILGIPVWTTRKTVPQKSAMAPPFTNARGF